AAPRRGRRQDRRQRPRTRRPSYRQPGGGRRLAHARRRRAPARQRRRRHARRLGTRPRLRPAGRRWQWRPRWRRHDQFGGLSGGPGGASGMRMDRRTGIKAIAAAGLVGAGGGLPWPAGRLFAQGSRASSSLDPYADMRWGRGYEGQRRADLGDGTYLNPIFAGDHPDPSILKDGADYYVTFSSFDAYPGLVIWHSRDLVNWRPVTAALRTPIGSVWAPELVKHGGRYFLYIPARFPDRRSIYVIHAEHIEGPWSEPIDLHLPDH